MIPRRKQMGLIKLLGPFTHPPTRPIGVTAVTFCVALRGMPPLVPSRFTNRKKKLVQHLFRTENIASCIIYLVFVFRIRAADENKSDEKESWDD